MNQPSLHDGVERPLVPPSVLVDVQRLSWGGTRLTMTALDANGQPDTNHAPVSLVYGREVEAEMEVEVEPAPEPDETRTSGSQSGVSQSLVLRNDVLSAHTAMVDLVQVWVSDVCLSADFEDVRCVLASSSVKPVPVAVVATGLACGTEGADGMGSAHMALDLALDRALDRAQADAGLARGVGLADAKGVMVTVAAGSAYLRLVHVRLIHDALARSMHADAQLLLAHWTDDALGAAFRVTLLVVV